MCFVYTFTTPPQTRVNRYWKWRYLGAPGETNYMQLPYGRGSTGGKTHLFSCLYFFSTVGWWRRRMKVHFWVDMSAERPSCVSKGVREEEWDWTWDFGDNFCRDSFSRETFPLGQHGLGWHEKRHNSCRSEVKLNKRFFLVLEKLGINLVRLLNM